MATIKKYNGSTWENAVVRKYGTATETIQSGDTIYANGQPITTYSLKGNTVQNGTPSPSNPVAVNGVGERTENLLQIPDVAETTKRGVTYHIKGNSLYIDGTSTTAFGFNIRGTFTLKAGTYTNQMYGFTGNRMYYSFDNVSATMCTSDVNLYKTFTISEDTTYANALVWINNEVAFNNEKIDFALFESEVPKEFEVYGYKIPILTNQTTTNIYIGDNPLRKSLDGTAYDTLDSNGTLTQRVDSDGSVLATPIVSQITVPSIPTVDGANTITIDTTVQPSEFSATWTGWHDAYVKEYDGTNWQ